MKQPESKTVDEYIAMANPKHKDILEKVRALINECSPDIIEKISYRMPTFTLNGNIVAHFHGAVSHLGFYPTPEGVDAFYDKLTTYKTGKGAIQFPYNKPIPYDLIREIVQFKIRTIG